LALCCDISVAAESSRYGANFTAMGFTPGGGITNLLPTLVGYNFAMEMMLTARFYKGRDLAQRGLFNYVLPKDEVLPQALTLARAIADKPAHVLEMLKDTLSLPRRQALLEAQGREHLLHKICFSQKQTQSHLEQAYLA
jgi:polyketide biosynthesis enoyl-CoA hydratase PksI